MRPLSSILAVAALVCGTAALAGTATRAGASGPAAGPAAQRGGSIAGGATQGRSRGKRGTAGRTRGTPRSAGGDTPPDDGARGLPEELRRAGAPPVDEPGLDIALRYFRMCDADGDGFMSYHEARTSLGLDQATFRVYDTSQDGLCDEEEFRARYAAIVSKGGAFKPPRVPEGGEEVRDRAQAAEVLDRHDRNGDERLDESEIEDALAEAGIPDVDMDLLMQAVDVDGSGSLDAGEVVRLLPLISRETDPARFLRQKPKSIEDLFGTPEDRAGGPDWAPEPPLIRGPVRYFLRLDLDRDGGITETDVKELLRPLRVPVRINTVIADLDRDGDGGISPEELRRSMERPRPESAPAR
jgi:Ca2+-binding EF-hand superfamily protein